MPLTGVVNPGRDAVLQLTVHRPTASEVLEVIIDTGFTATLLLPGHVAARLRLPVLGRVDVALADGSRVVYQLCGCEIDWVIGRRVVAAYAGPATDVLLGTALLANHRLLIDYPAALVEVA